jgi:hypothetical protein
MVRRSVALVVLFWVSAGAAYSAEHVRVVLDLSGSLLANDRGRLAILSTILLRDLVNPNTTLGDTFEVLPFPEGWQWNDPNDPPPAANRDRIKADFRAPELFAREVRALRYKNNLQTYFYPGIKASVDDLKSLGGPRDTRVIVLITDGVPPERFQERERELIQGLWPEMQSNGIYLYVLTFSEEATKNKAFFEEAMVPLVAGRRLGDVFVDADGRRLLTTMLRIFSQSFGYTFEEPRSNPSQIDLEDGTSPDRVAVVGLLKGSGALHLGLHTASGDPPNTDGDQRLGREIGASFVVSWVLSPDPGPHRVDVSDPAAEVVVLRPAPLILTVVPWKGSEIHQAMAGREMSIGCLLKSPAGRDPGPGIHLQYVPLGPEDSSGEAAWIENTFGPHRDPNSLIVAPEGRTYRLRLKFPENPDGRGLPYTGKVQVRALRGAAMVGSLPRGHPMDVHPYLDLRPTPPSRMAEGEPLGRGDEGCAEFRIDVEGTLPKQLRIQAVLDKSVDPGIRQDQLRAAVFTLDDSPLRFEDSSPQHQEGWFDGKELGGSDFGDSHRICVTAGRPRNTDKSPVLELSLRFSVLGDPYSEFVKIRPFTFQVQMRRPGPLEAMRPLLSFVIPLGLMAIFLWYGRSRPDIPPDLQVAVAHARAPGSGSTQPLGKPWFLPYVLGFTAERPIRIEDMGTVAWVKPVTEDLFRLRVSRKASLLDSTGERDATGGRRTAAVRVRDPYILKVDARKYRLQLLYE